MKKKLVFGLCVLAVLMMFTAAGQRDSSGPVTLSVVWFNDSNESEVFEQTIQDYLVSHPGIKTDIQLRKCK